MRPDPTTGAAGSEGPAAVLPAPALPAAVLWDMDGTLVDSEPYWIAAEHELVERYGGQWSDELAHQLVGQDLLYSARFIRAHSPVTLEPVAVVEALAGRVAEGLATAIPWRPGAAELLAELGAAGVPCALVTMSWRSLADALVAALPAGTFAAVVTGDMVSAGKPDPGPYLLACRMLGVDPGDCVAVEDSPAGVRSAAAAGVPTVGVPHVVPVPGLPGVVLVDTLAGMTAARLTELARLAAADRSPEQVASL